MSRLHPSVPSGIAGPWLPFRHWFSPVRRTRPFLSFLFANIIKLLSAVERAWIDRIILSYPGPIFHSKIKGLSENRKYDQQQGIFCLMKPFFRRNTLCIARKNGAQQPEKTRCLGVLTVFRQAQKIKRKIPFPDTVQRLGALSAVWSQSTKHTDNYHYWSNPAAC